jgi:hypothetical protein
MVGSDDSREIGGTVENGQRRLLQSLSHFRALRKQRRLHGKIGNI